MFFTFTTFTQIRKMPLSYASIAATTTTTTTEPVPAIATPVTATPVTAAPAAAKTTPAPAKEEEKTFAEPSLCIPRIPTGYNDGMMMDMIQKEMGYGKVAKVDMIQKTDRNGVDFVTAFIHFEQWFTTEDAVEDREKLTNGEKIKVIYDQGENRYFMVSKSYAKPRGEHRGRDGHHQAKRQNKPFVDTDGWTHQPGKNRRGRGKPNTVARASDQTMNTSRTTRDVINPFANLSDSD
jgi:hypothetical protein